MRILYRFGVTVPSVTVDAPEERPRRPLGVTVVAGLSGLQALLLLLVGAGVLASSGEPEVQEALEGDASLVMTAGAVFAVIGLTEIVLAILLVRGSDTARTVFGVLNTLHVGVAVYGVIALEELHLESFVGMALPVAVLWFLYGSKAAIAYFER